MLMIFIIWAALHKPTPQKKKNSFRPSDKLVPADVDEMYIDEMYILSDTSHTHPTKK